MKIDFIGVDIVGMGIMGRPMAGHSALVKVLEERADHKVAAD